MNLKTLSLFLKIAAVLWVVWGLVHIFAGVMTISFVGSGDIGGGFAGIADKMDPESFKLDYPAAVGGVLGQHGFNLAWIGLVTTICSIYIWNKNGNAIFLAAITGGLADVGYFLFMDLGGFVHFVPGTVMTIVSASAIILSFTAYFQSDRLKQFQLAQTS